MEAEAPPPLRMIISGTAATGKTYLIHCVRLLLGDRVRVAAPTGVAAFNIDGHTLPPKSTHQGRVQGSERRTSSPYAAVTGRNALSRH